MKHIQKYILILAISSLVLLPMFVPQEKLPIEPVAVLVKENKQAKKPLTTAPEPQATTELQVEPQVEAPPVIEPLIEEQKPALLAENEIESVVNNSRQANGLGRLVSNQKLRNSACAKAQHMLDHQYWAHVAPDGTTPWFFIESAGYPITYAGENLARGFNTADETVVGWLNSQTHRDNMLNSSFKDQGICSISGNHLEVNLTITVQHLGTGG